MEKHSFRSEHSNLLGSKVKDKGQIHAKCRKALIIKGKWCERFEKERKTVRQ